MSRHKMIALALGTVALAALPLAQGHAQSGLSSAERTCARYGVMPNTAAFDICVNRTVSAFEEGQPALAERQAALVRDANDLCRSYGIAPATLGNRECVNREVERRAALEPARYTPSRSAMTVDAYGFRYDSEGNLYDPDGYPIRPVP